MKPTRDPNLDPLKDEDIRFLSGLVLIAIAVIVVRVALPHFSNRRLADVDAVEPRPVAFQIDLNTAGWAEISQLPGIGETMARRIVSERQESGPFQDLERLDAIRGIGPKTLTSIRPFIAPIRTRVSISTIGKSTKNVPIESLPTENPAEKDD